MKIPKKLRMLGYDWKLVVVNDKNSEGGGDFSWSKKIITINNRYGDIEAILLHEIIEAILVHHLARFYTNESSSEFRFMFNHTQFTTIVGTLFQTLKDNKLI